MKLFSVRIDNDPGEWKSGYDKKVLVLAETSKEAVEKVRNGWCEIYDDVSHSYVYGFYEGEKESIYDRSEIYATEIRFKNHDFIPVREAKLKRINKK